MFKNLLKETIKIAAILAVAIPALAFFATWQGPKGAPPTENALPPVNVGPDDQAKEGGLSVGTFVSRLQTILARDGGNVGVGTVNPQTPAPNGQASGNLDANDVWVRGANGGVGQWVSQMSGGGGGCPLSRKAFLFGADLACLLDGDYTEISDCRTDFGDWVQVQGRFINGKVQNRILKGCRGRNGAWVDGLINRCVMFDYEFDIEITARGAELSVSSVDDDTDKGPNYSTCTGLGRWH